MAKNNKVIKFLCDFLPLIAFFISYKLLGIMAATATIVVVTVISTIINYVYNKELSLVNIISAILITVFGSITVLSNNAMFIKLKPTIVNLIFASILLFGVMRKKSYLKLIFDKAITLPDEMWIILSKRFALFFLFMAGLNEFIWRVFSEELWVWYKVFGIIILGPVFIASQIYFIKKHSTNFSKIE
jgi:intracellular septation protein